MLHTGGSNCGAVAFEVQGTDDIGLRLQLFAAIADRAADRVEKLNARSDYDCFSRS